MQCASLEVEETKSCSRQNQIFLAFSERERTDSNVSPVVVQLSVTFVVINRSSKGMEHGKKEERQGQNKQSTHKKRSGLIETGAHDGVAGVSYISMSTIVVDPSLPRTQLESIRLNPLLYSILRSHFHIETYFPIQQHVIPAVLASHKLGSWGDVCVCSPTGSGKTIAYVLPIVQVWAGSGLA